MFLTIKKLPLLLNRENGLIRSKRIVEGSAAIAKPAFINFLYLINL